MRRIRACRWLVFVVLLGLSCAAFAEENLLVNGRFETWDAKGQPLHWRRNSGTFKRSEESESGRSSIRLNAIDHRKQEGSVLQRIDLKGEHKLSLHMRFKTEGSALVFVTARAFDAKAKRLKIRPRYYSTALKQREDWTSLRWLFSTPPETNRLSICLHVKSSDGKPGAAWCDSFLLTSKEVALENQFLKVIIEPLAGGRIRKLVLKDKGGKAGVYWEGARRPGGMAAEILPADKYPGFLRDAPYKVVEMDSSSRRIRLAYKLTHSGAAGTRVEKEISLPENECAVITQIKLTNESAGEVTHKLRLQQCLPAGEGTFTYPAVEFVGMYDCAKDRTLKQWKLGALGGGWIAFASSTERNGMVFMFDHKDVSQAFCWFGRNLSTVEWACRSVALAPGASWETSYRIVPLLSGAPVFDVGSGIIAGLKPLRFKANENYRLDLSAWQAQTRGSVHVTGVSATGLKQEVSQKLDLAPMRVSTLELPWKAGKIIRIKALVDVEGVAEYEAFLDEIGRFVKEELGIPMPPRPSLPPLAGQVRDFFPFGGYLHGAYTRKVGTPQQLWRRTLRLYRRNYLNTVTGHIQMRQPILSGMERTGREWGAEMLRKRGMRLIPRDSIFRHFENGNEVFHENITRDQARNEWLRRRSVEIKLLKMFAEKYNDVILAYDVSDEPGPKFIPWYMHVQDIFREINPSRPAMPILNLSTLSYMPYAPIFYGDIYPIKPKTRGGRNPWAVAKNVRATVLESRNEKPVWVMLQAFSVPLSRWVLPNKAETRYMAYAVLANGGKGIMYHGIVNGSAWLHGKGYHTGFLERIGAWAPEWAVVGEVGRQVTAIGPLLTDTILEAKPDVSVECENITRGSGFYRGPAILATMLRQRQGGGCFIALQNQDMTSPRSGKLVLPPRKQAGRALYDLTALRPLATASAHQSTSVDIELPRPGDARFLYLDSEDDARAVLLSVHKNHYQNEKAIFDIDMELATGNSVPVKEVSGGLAQAEKAFQEKRYAHAHKVIIAARTALSRKIRESQSVGPACEAANAIRQSLSEVVQTYQTNSDACFPKKRSKEIEAIVMQTAEAFGRLNQLEDRLYLGQAEQVVAELLKLRVDVEQHRRNISARFNQPAL